MRLTAHAFPTLGGDTFLGAEASLPGVASCTFPTRSPFRIGHQPVLMGSGWPDRPRGSLCVEITCSVGIPSTTDTKSHPFCGISEAFLVDHEFSLPMLYSCDFGSSNQRSLQRLYHLNRFFSQYSGTCCVPGPRSGILLPLTLRRIPKVSSKACIALPLC